MMNQRRAKFLVASCILLCGWAARPALPQQQQSAAPPKPGAPAAAPTPGPQDVTSPRFNYGGSAAQIPAVFLGNLIFLPVRLNGGKPGLFALDSAAEKCAVDRKIAGDPAGNEMHYAVLALAGVQLPFVTLPVVSRDEFAQQVGQPYQGTLGRDFFDRVVVEVNYHRQTVQLYDPSAFTYTGQGKSFPLTFSGPVPLIRAKFDVPGHRSETADFAVDTALDSGVIFYRGYTDSQRISAAHFKSEPASYPEVDGGAKIFLGRLKTFQIGPYGVEDIVGDFTQEKTKAGADKNIAGAIGANFLRRFTVIYDFPHQRMILEPNIQMNHDTNEDMSGLSIIAKGPNLKLFEVTAVQSGTPAAKAGIVPGDVIAGIGDEAAADLTLAAVRNLFRQVGYKYKVLIDRKGQTITTSLEMRRRI
jgi:PDZ domain